MTPIIDPLRCIVVGVVEDDPAIRDALTLVLADQGWNTRAYARGEDFLSDLEAGIVFDGLLLDPHLPGVDGVAVAQAAAGRRIPGLVMTARPDSPVTDTLLRMGCNVVTKPVGASRLVSELASLMATKLA